MRENVLSSDELAGKIQLTHFAKKACYQYLVAARKPYKIRPGGDEGWGTITPLFREYWSSRSYPKTKALSAIPEGTIIGPDLEVHIVKFLGGYGIKVAIPSVANPMDTSYVVISRETERFVNETHDHKEELRSSNELLTDFQGSGRSEFYEERGTSSINETWAPRSIKKLVRALSALHQQKHPYTHKDPFLRMRGNGRSFIGSCDIQDGDKNAASL